MPAPSSIAPRAAEARALAAEGVCLAHAADRMGVHRTSLWRWSKRECVPFADGRPPVARAALAYARGLPQTRAAALRNIAKAMRAAQAVTALPVTGAERRRYIALRKKCQKAGAPVTRAEVLRLIGCADLAGGAA